MRLSRAAAGARGETIVADALIERGFTILARNARVGRLELDIVARRFELVVVCEVRTTTSENFGAPIESLDEEKAERVRRAGHAWLQQNPIRGAKLRFDAAGVLLSPAGELVRLDYYEAAM